jgi:hypothetical protein
MSTLKMEGVKSSTIFVNIKLGGVRDKETTI